MQYKSTETNQINQLQQFKSTISAKYPYFVEPLQSYFTM